MALPPIRGQGGWASLGVGGAVKCINILTSVDYLPNTLSVPLHFHSVVQTSNSLPLQMTHRIRITLPL